MIEFRNSAWVNDDTFRLLRELDLGFCSVDEPRLKGLMPPTAEATSRIGYVRFHGRNAYQGKSAKNAQMFARMLDLTLPVDSASPAGGQMRLGEGF